MTSKHFRTTHVSSPKYQWCVVKQSKSTPQGLYVPTHVIGFEHDLDVAFHIAAVHQLYDDAVTVCVLDDLSDTKAATGHGRGSGVRSGWGLWETALHKHYVYSISQMMHA